MDSVTSEEKKVLEGSDQSDLDYQDLIMNLDSDSDDLDLDASPASPVLRGYFPRLSQAVNEVSESSTSKPCRSSNIELSKSCEISPIRSSESGGVTINESSRPAKTSGEEQTDSSENPVFHRSVQRRTQAGGGTCTAQQKNGPHEICMPITGPSPNVSLTTKKKRGRSFSNTTSSEGDRKRDLPKRIRHDLPGPSTSDIHDSDSDSDVISLYARDEDYKSLYASNAREVTLTDQGLQKQQNCHKEKQRNVVLTNESSLSGKLAKDSKLDLRYHIPKKTLDDQQNIDMTKIMQLLDENTCRRRMLVAANNFCKAYMDRSIKKVNKRVCYVTRRLAEMLLKFREMEYLCRIVCLAIDLQIILSDNVLCSLIEHLGQNSETGKVAVILTQIKEKSVLVGSSVHMLGNSILRANKTTVNICGNALMSDATKKIQPNWNVVAPTQRTVVHQSGIQPKNTVGYEQCQRSTDYTLLKKEIAPQKKRSILRTPESNSAALGLSNEPLYIQIPNLNVERQKKSAFGCKAHDKKSQMFKTCDSILGTTPNSTERKQNSSDGVDMAMLGKCLGQLAEAVGEHPIRDALFSAIGDLFPSSKDRGMNVVQVCNDDSARFMLFLKSALEGLQGTGNEEKTKSWLSWISAGVIQRFSLQSTYKLSRLMKTMKVHLIPPPSGLTITPAEKKMQYHIANKIVKGCLSQNDIDLALQVIEEYCAGKNNDLGPVLGPKLCDMLCSIASHAIGAERYFDAAKCLAMLPAGFGDGKECPLMEKTLFGILNREDQYLVDEEKICNEMVDQMLIRSMATEIRSIIARAFCANVVPVFKYLEGKGVYRRPQIARSPHLILIPYILSIEEMALVIQRHLTELSEFVMEMNRKLRVDMPMRIILWKNTGSLLALSPFKINNMQAAYDAGFRRLSDAVTGILDPPMKISSRESNPQTQEHVIMLDINTVRMWMMANTEYDEERESA